MESLVLPKKYSVEDLVEKFDYKSINKAPGAIFDNKKLKWMNGDYSKNVSL